MSFRYIRVEACRGVGRYCFNRAPRNAVDWDMLEELTPAFETLRDRDDVKVIVIASMVERYFSSGADISAFAAVRDEQMVAWIDLTQRLAALIRDCPKPVLAAINGVAVGGGLEMTFHADLRFAASDARLGQPEINIGFIPPIAGTQGLVRLVGRSMAFRLLYEGTLIDATTAKEIGLVDFVVPPEKLADEVQAYGEMLAAKPANTLAAIRRCLIDGGATSFVEGAQIEREQAVSLAGHANFREGVSAFLEKREPEWT